MKSWKTKSGYTVTLIMAGRSNVFLLSNGKQNILIDTSVRRLRAKLLRRLEQAHIHSIDYIILTHAHFDHAANANAIKRKYNSKVIIHREEAGYLSVGNNIVPEGTFIYSRIMMNLVGKRIFHRFYYEPCIPDLIVHSTFDLKEIGFNAYLIHNPGHTAGSMSLIVDDEIAIAGDSMFGVFKKSVFPPFAQDVDQMVRSWKVLLETGCQAFFPSHGTANSRILLQKEYDLRVRGI
ncbi:MAG TPA: MBL fold metallo-hydrolase [Prolixibacteraceae bacterium]|nr:MBL fold metallo-hydrolase [Prolixibacteraceae bacterium]